MKKICIILAAVFLYGAAFSQANYDSTKQLTTVSAYGSHVGNWRVKNSFWIPTDTIKLKVSDSSAIALKEGVLYYYTGYYWVSIATPYGNVTASNGLTKTGNDIALGGALTEDTTNISTEDKVFVITNNGDASAFSGTTQLILDPLNKYWAIGDAVGGFGSATSIHIIDSIGTVLIDGDLKVQGSPGFNYSNINYPLYWDQNSQYYVPGNAIDSVWRDTDSIYFKIRGIDQLTFTNGKIVGIKSAATGGGSGTVTSIATNDGTGITGGTITTTGTLAIDTVNVIATKWQALQNIIDSSFDVTRPTVNGTVSIFEKISSTNLQLSDLKNSASVTWTKDADSNLVATATGGSMVYPGAGIPLSTGSAWGTSITDNSADWNSAFGWGNHASAGYMTAASSNTVTNKDLTSGTNTFPTFNQSTTGSAATLTTTRTLWGQNFDGSANVTGNMTLGSSSITMTGSLAATGARVTKGWFTDIESTNAPTIGGSAATGTGGLVRATSPSITTGITGGSTFSAFNTTTTTLNFAGAATTLNVGGTPTSAITHNYSANATATATTKTVNLGTGGAAGSTSNINIGSANGGTTTINSPNVTAGTITARWKARVGSTTSSATPTINTDNTDIYKLTAQTADITSFTTNLTGTPNDGDVLEIQITGTAARAITWGASFVSSSVTLPATTVTTETLTVVFQYYTTSSYGNNKWVCANYY